MSGKTATAAKPAAEMKKGGRPKASKGVFGRVLKLLFKFCHFTQ